VEHLFYLTTHDFVVIHDYVCHAPTFAFLENYFLYLETSTFAIPVFVVVVWVRERSLRLADEKPQCMYKRLFGEVCRRWTLLVTTYVGMGPASERWQQARKSR